MTSSLFVRNAVCRAGLLSLAFAAILALAGPAARAQTYNVSLDTSQLIAGDTYALDYQLNQGNAANPASTVNVSNFVFGGTNPNGTVGPVGTPTTTTNSTGDLSSTVTQNTSATAPNSADFNQNAILGSTSGSTFSFTVDGSALTAPPINSGNSADQFSFSLFDTNANAGAGAPVATSDPTTNNALFTLVNNGTTNGGYVATGYSYSGTGGGPVMTQVSPAPELASTISFGLLLALFGLGLVRSHWRKGRAEKAACAK